MRIAQLALGFFATVSTLVASGQLLRSADARPAAAQPAPVPVKLRELELSFLGLRLDAPADVQITQLPGLAASLSSDAMALTVSSPSSGDPRSVAGAWEEAVQMRGMYMRSEALADGWILTYESRGLAGTTYWVSALRAVGGRTIRCATTARTLGQQEAAVNACKSMRPAA